ncbi:MAG: hypothetical protein U9R50_06830 [Campylobacterota bacterium]|nr:hypothetical protein [Campylobacterota bacterium]
MLTKLLLGFVTASLLFSGSALACQKNKQIRMHMGQKVGMKHAKGKRNTKLMSPKGCMQCKK